MPRASGCNGHTDSATVTRFYCLAVKGNNDCLTTPVTQSHTHRRRRSQQQVWRLLLASDFKQARLDM
jgi:uncharacterized membrane protein